VDSPAAASPLILFVDDFDDARDMYGQYLAFVGYRVQMAASGAEAVHLANANPPALVLMDIEMPDMSGGDALRLLRANPALASIPIIAFTAHALEHERVAQLVDGFDGVIPKPCLPDDLVTLIEPFLTGHRELD
jgi:CheY-like chemotaxis protein